MVAGHLREKGGYFHIVLSYTDKDGKRHTPSKSTGLPVKGNKKRAEAMLRDARHEMEDELESRAAAREHTHPDDPADIGFTVFMLDWLEMMKSNIEITTYSAYSIAMKSRIIPYFDEHLPGLMLKELTPKHIQDYYTYEMKVRGISANTVIHRHANIRKALQYAFKIGLLSSNPADRIERPKKEDYIADFYNAAELEQLFQVVKDDPIELGVILAAFYGLRRSEAIGLKWSAIDFERKTITIRHIVTEATIDGKSVVVAKDRTKTKKSQRSLPLVPPFEALLLRLKVEQEQNRKLCGSAYYKDHAAYIYVNELGERVKPGYVTQHFPALLEKNGLRRIRFHDLRHSCASLLHANGVSIKEIQEWLGHSTISTTANIYTHLDFSSKIASANAIIGVYPT
ncbi:MAG: site-specific integrase [Oscillospiraceae bacterium]|jgi:integrase|nr:site-specific integrase [Oscillospiraceae bacterium]